MDAKGLIFAHGIWAGVDQPVQGAGAKRLAKPLRKVPCIVFCLSALADAGVAKCIVSIHAYNYLAVSGAVARGTGSCLDMDVSFLLVEQDVNLASVIADACEFAGQSKLLTLPGSTLIADEVLRGQVRQAVLDSKGAVGFVTPAKQQLEMMALDAAAQRELADSRAVQDRWQTFTDLFAYARQLARYSQVELAGDAQTGLGCCANLLQLSIADVKHLNGMNFRTGSLAIR